MKIVISALTTIALSSVAADFATVGIADYNGGVVTSLGENEFALCGQDTVGCLGITASSSKSHFLRKCNTNPEVTFGEFEGGAQNWKYDQALLRSGSDSSKCLGISASCEESLDAEASYPLMIHDCSSANAKQRWLLGDDDRVHSGANYNLCLTVADSSDAISVTPCPAVIDNNENEAEEPMPLGQSLQLVVSDSTTKPMEPFVQALQTEYGVEDMINLIFWTDEEIEEKNIVETLQRAVQTLEVFPAQTILDTLESMGPQTILGTLESMTKDEPVYTSIISSFSNIITIPASELVPQFYASSEPIRLVATMGSSRSQTFTIHPDLDTVVDYAGCEEEAQFSELEDAPVLAIVLTVLGILVVATFVAAFHRRAQASKVAAATQSSTETKDADVGDIDADTDASDSVVDE